jgi:hypothetical protein
MRTVVSENLPVVPPFPRQRLVSDPFRVNDAKQSNESPHPIPIVIPDKRKRKDSDPHGWTDEDIDRVIHLMHLRPDRASQACEECRQRRCKVSLPSGNFLFRSLTKLASSVAEVIRAKPA